MIRVFYNKMAEVQTEVCCNLLHFIEMSHSKKFDKNFSELDLLSFSRESILMEVTKQGY